MNKDLLFQKYDGCLRNTAMRIVRTKDLDISEYNEILSILREHFLNKMKYVDILHPGCHSLCLRIIRQGASEYFSGLSGEIVVDDIDISDIDDSDDFYVAEIPDKIQEFCKDLISGYNKTEMLSRYPNYYELFEEARIWLER